MSKKESDLFGDFRCERLPVFISSGALKVSKGAVVVIKGEISGGFYRFTGRV